MRRLLLTLGTTAAILSASHAFAQTYDISWHTIAGGGGTSSGGQYSVTGTIGQPAAGNLSGGQYSVTGGFWGVIAAVQVAGSPTLTISASPSPGHVVISWSAASTGFLLQQNAAAGTASWSAVNTNTFPIVVNNGLNTVTVPATAGNEYFRLVGH